MKFKKVIVTVSALLFGSTVFAAEKLICPETQDLLSTYLLGLEYDPVLQSARAAQMAAREALPQARAQFLSTINASANYANNHLILRRQLRLNYDSYIYNFTVNQPILHFDHWATYDQACNQVKQANAAYAAAEQDLILRVANGYFGVLKAIDALYYAEAQRKAFAKFQEQTEQRFKVGLIPITDFEIAKARHDNAKALEIAARAEVQNQIDRLTQITCYTPKALMPLRDKLPLIPPEPQDMECWVATALKQNFTLQAAYFNASAARETIKVQNYGHLPFIDAQGNFNRNSPIPATSTPKQMLTSVGVTVNVPLFAGGSVVSRTRQARYNFHKADKDFETEYRNTESITRQSYRGVLTQIDQIRALSQAVKSNQSALQATEAAFNVGTRTIVDVLNAQSDLIRSQKDYADARNNYVLQLLTLKQAAGTVSPEDLQHINAWLKDPDCKPIKLAQPSKPKKLPLCGPMSGNNKPSNTNNANSASTDADKSNTDGKTENEKEKVGNEKIELQEIEPSKTGTTQVTPPQNQSTPTQNSNQNTGPNTQQNNTPQTPSTTPTLTPAKVSKAPTGKQLKNKKSTQAKNKKTTPGKGTKLAKNQTKSSKPKNKTTQLAKAKKSTTQKIAKNTSPVTLKTKKQTTLAEKK